MLAPKARENSSPSSEQAAKKGSTVHEEDHVVKRQFNPVWHAMATNTIHDGDGWPTSGSIHASPSIQKKSSATSNQMSAQRMFAESEQEQNLDGSAIQPKLTIDAPDDPYEQEADAVADQVMRMHDGNGG